MAFEPDYGETLLSYEESEALTPEARTLLGDPIRKADLYDLEQRIQIEVADEWWGNLLNFNIPMRDLLNDHFARDLHRRLYAPVWEWGGAPALARNQYWHRPGAHRRRDAQRVGRP